MKSRRIATVVSSLIVLLACYKWFSGSNDIRQVGSSESSRKNVLFMITDDMRTQLGCYSGPDSMFDTIRMHTPNLDRLASKSLLLRRAYSQYTLCCPSRSSMLTGRRPDITGVLNNDVYWRNIGLNFTTLPQYFKQNGYHSIGIAKVFHKFKDPPSWTEYTKFGNPEKDVLDFKKGATWLAYTNEQNADKPLFDIRATDYAIRRLEELAPKARSGEEPFLLAIGFNKPHVSFVCPEDYFDLYPLESGRRYMSKLDWQTPIVREGAGMVNVSMIDGELRMKDVVLREHRRAYFACISYVDDLVGQLLETLDRLGLSDTTVVTFVADHGYHLGENGKFGKNVLTEVSSHVPMMIHVPGLTDHGVESNSIVESLDLFPTIVQAAGLEPPPRCPDDSRNVSFCAQGTSLLTLVEDPDAHIKDAAFTQIRFGTSSVKGYSMRTDRYRYTEYVRVDALGDSTDVYIDLQDNPPELFDHNTDKEETVNRISSSKYHNIEKELRRALHDYIKKSNGVSSLRSEID
ncbi:hypothetical protein LSH36_138g09111 [Paralvinella palmiformis]|uniref:Sulfatase N-terminal domain-containing protein n=1 Tax=Paralvinella palmiformis TaxID=53620 RepID=A0AAD9N9B7_9ANNE|nr:hypothetical protein LSH36_138g09111 [Paralvinella palmiformis]